MFSRILGVVSHSPKLLFINLVLEWERSHYLWIVSFGILGVGQLMGLDSLNPLNLVVLAGHGAFPLPASVLLLALGVGW